MNKDTIEITDVYKKFSSLPDREKYVINGISLQIRRGEFIGLLGPNGSGKSTLARLINGLILPSSGRVVVNGLDTAHRGNALEIKRSVGMVFQNPDHQIISSIVEEDIAFGPQNQKLSHDEVKKRVKWAMQAMGIEQLRHHAPHLLSGGQKQRVAIAGVLAMQPGHLILDEPTSMLDPQGRKEILSTLHRLNKKFGISVILISHNMEDLVEADRLIILQQGRIMLEGNPDLIFSDPDKLLDYGLNPPEVVQLTSSLRTLGYQIDSSINTVPKMVNYICQLSKLRT